MVFLMACMDFELIETEKFGSNVPIIDVQPSSVDFGAQAYLSTTPVEIQIKNIGTSNMHIDSFDILNSEAFALGIPYEMGSIPPKEEIIYELLFTSTAPSQEGILRIQSNDPSTPIVDVPLSGTLPSAALRFSPNPLDFGHVVVGEEKILNVLIDNIGGLDVSVLNVYLPTSPFFIDAEELPVHITTGDSVAFPLHFVPAEEGDFEVQMWFESEIASHAITLLGNAEMPIIEEPTPEDPIDEEIPDDEDVPEITTQIFEVNCTLLDDGIPYETTSNLNYVIDHHGDTDLYHYEPSGVHGLLGSTNPQVDFETMRQYVLGLGSELSFSNTITYSESSTINTFSFATFTYLMCDFVLDSTSSPSDYEVSVGTVDDGIQVMLNGEILGHQKLGTGSGRWNLSAADPEERNTLIVILVDDSAHHKYIHDFSFLRNGVIIEH